jgi:hypothetical protein
LPQIERHGGTRELGLSMIHALIGTALAYGELNTPRSIPEILESRSIGKLI